MNPLSAISSSAPTEQNSAASPAAPRPELLQAAREFESIFLRSLLSPLEKTTGSGTTGSMKSGQSTYGSMVVGALADSLSRSGGIGLSEVIARAMAQAESAPKDEKGGP